MVCEKGQACQTSILHTFQENAKPVQFLSEFWWLNQFPTPFRNISATLGGILGGHQEVSSFGCSS